MTAPPDAAQGALRTLRLVLSGTAAVGMGFGLARYGRSEDDNLSRRRVHAGRKNVQVNEDRLRHFERVPTVVAAAGGG